MVLKRKILKNYDNFVDLAVHLLSKIMRREMLEALKALAIGNIKKAKMNVEVYLANPVGIGEHPDVLGAIQDQIDLIAKEEERLEVINKYFEEK